MYSNSEFLRTQSALLVRLFLRFLSTFKNMLIDFDIDIAGWEAQLTKREKAREKETYKAETVKI